MNMTLISFCDIAAGALVNPSRDASLYVLVYLTCNEPPRLMESQAHCVYRKYGLKQDTARLVLSLYRARVKF